MIERSDKAQPLRGFFGILYLGAIAMFFATIWDQQISAWLRNHNSMLLEHLMAPSIFEGEPLGAGDLIIFALITCLTLYLIASFYEKKQLRSYMEIDVKWRRLYPPFFNTTAKMRRLRPQLGYILVNALCTALLFVHTIKWLMARPRPGQVLREQFPFSPWYEVGPQFITDGIYRGSFPSGHTALATVTLGIAYCLIYCSGGRLTRYTGHFLFLWTAVVSGLMGAHRVMTGAHWLTDVVFTLFGCWLLTHWIFHWGLRVPTRVGAAQQRRTTQSKPFSELLLCVYLFLFSLGIVCISFSVRSVLIPDTPLLFILFPIGLCMSWLSMRAALQMEMFWKKTRISESGE